MMINSDAVTYNKNFLQKSLFKKRPSDSRPLITEQNNAHHNNVYSFPRVWKERLQWSRSEVMCWNSEYEFFLWANHPSETFTVKVTTTNY